MEYNGKLYGKVGSHFFLLEETTEDIDALKTHNEALKKKLAITENALNHILVWQDDKDFEGTDWDYPETIASRAIEMLAKIDGF